MKFLTDGRGLYIWRDPDSLKHRSQNPHNGHTEDTKRDRDEILRYVVNHDGCTRFDIELECHQTKRPVLLHLAALQKSGRIKRYGNSYQVSA
ncbi:MAG: hypothetical protein WC124_02095 [Desulfoplanes sp.]